MTSAPPCVGLLSLPTELLLQILGYVLDHGPDAGLTYSTPDAVPQEGNQRFTGLILDPTYSASACLHILLVCRQLRVAFTKLAFQRTVFVVANGHRASLHTLQPLQRDQMNNLRNVMLLFEPYRIGLVTSWRWPFGAEALRLDTLTIAFTTACPTDSRMTEPLPTQNTRELVGLLRRLEHVRRLRFVQNATVAIPDFRTWYSQVVGHLLKEDHYQRYDAAGAPRVENTWWDWRFDATEKAIVSEPDYMEMVAPLIAKLMDDLEAASA